jgi:exportin-5
LVQGELGYEGQHDEFGQTLCETMATLGASHLSAVGGSDKKLAFLQHMLSFAQHPYLLLADKALPLWTKLLQDAAQSATNAAASSSQGSSSPRQHSSALPADCVAALMDVAADQLQVSLLVSSFWRPVACVSCSLSC